ncbi:MAG: hypothetical protein WC750_03945 [Patescibacteria group bacterium]|jgi:hypothetical protein
MVPSQPSGSYNFLRSRFLIGGLLAVCFFGYPLLALADCCVCTHPEVNGKFCISYPAGFDCSTLKNNSDASLQAATCANATTCAQTALGGSCVNTPVDSNNFNFASLPKTPGVTQKKSGTTAPSQTPAPGLNIPIPGINLSPAYQDQGIVYVPFLAEYIVGVQKMLIGIALIAAAIMLVYGGITYILSGTGARVRDSKEIIQDALIGMALILGSYVILANLNPNLTTLPSLMVPVVKREPFDFSTGYTENGSPSDVICSEDCPAMKHPEAKGSGSRMKAACKGGGTKEALKAVLEVWAKEARPYGSVYIRGGTGYGKDIKVASPYTGNLFCLLGAKGWLSSETKQACGLPDDFSFDSTPGGRGSCSSSEGINLKHKDLAGNQILADAQKGLNKGPCYASLKKDFSSFYVCPIKCNDLFGADCSGFVGLALGCAGIKHNASVVYKVQGQANAEVNNKVNPVRSVVGVTVCKNLATKQYVSCHSEGCDPATSYDDKICSREILPGYTAFSLSKEEFLSNVLPGLPFGTTIEYMCNSAPIPHMFMYTGKMGLPFETIESGGAGGDPSQGSVTFLNWHGQSEFIAGRGIQIKPSMSAYISGLCGAGSLKYIYAMNDL